MIIGGIVEKNKMIPDLICNRIEKLKKGLDPYFIYEFEHSFFVLGDQQFYLGQSMLLLKNHYRELHEIPLKEYLGLSQELYLASSAIHKTFHPWKLNHQSLGNKVEHVHWHILPRYENELYQKEYPFTAQIKGEVDTQRSAISEIEARDLINKIRNQL